MASSPAVFLCNGAKPPSRAKKYRSARHLEYRAGQDREQNVEICLTSFIDQVHHVPARMLDLLEIAAYVFSADRMTKRGTTDSLEYHNWSRSMEFVVRVRDVAFWSAVTTQKRMCEALRFMTGDRAYEFKFEGGHLTDSQSLFDAAGIPAPPPTQPRVMLFSGGLDSLAGAVDALSRSDDTACLVSHESQTGTIKTQRGLVIGLQEQYSSRVRSYKFKCRLSGGRAAEETQRTRSFLYFSVAFVVARMLGCSHFEVPENGFTAAAFAERQDLQNARASRTTHPKTIGMMQDFLSLVADVPFRVTTPFRWKTKAEILRLISDTGHSDLITSTRSCSATFQPSELGLQCGKCSQCVERRIAAFSAGLAEIDGAASYHHDLTKEAITDPEHRNLVIDYLRLGLKFAQNSMAWFEQEKLTELAHLVGYVDGADEHEQIANLWTLCRNHGREVVEAIHHIRNECDDPTSMRPAGGLLEIIADRDYLRPPIELAARKIAQKLLLTIPTVFKSAAPQHENRLNDAVEAFVKGEGPGFAREFPVIQFATARTVPDHSFQSRLFIESKLLRKKTPPSKITDELAADLMKYKAAFILFFLYDPERAIKDDTQFSNSIEAQGSCRVCICR